MRKVCVFAFGLLVFASAAMAQEKGETKWHCNKPTAEQKYDVGDVAGHAYALSQGTCEATSSTMGEKSGAYTEFQEQWKASGTNHGRFIVTMDDGGKTYYTYQGTVNPAKKSAANKWKIVGGTGKHKGATGAGSCTGTMNDDGSSDWECSGTMGAAKP